MSRCFALLCLLLLPVPLWAQQQATVAEKMELEAPLPLPEPRPLWPVAVGAALLLSSGLLVLYLRKRKHTPQPALLAHETALLRLAQADGFITAHDCAAFAALFDQTLRRYLKERFGLAAPQQTASELISLLVNAEKLPEPLQAHSATLPTWIELCEMVKFAGTALSQADMAELITQLRAFIETTTAEAAK